MGHYPGINIMNKEIEMIGVTHKNAQEALKYFNDRSAGLNRAFKVSSNNTEAAIVVEEYLAVRRLEHKIVEEWLRSRKQNDR